MGRDDDVVRCDRELAMLSDVRRRLHETQGPSVRTRVLDRVFDRVLDERIRAVRNQDRRFLPPARTR